MTGRRLHLSLAAVAAILFFVSLLVGPAALPPAAFFAALFGSGDATAILIAQEIRLPRALLAAVIGAGLGLSGAALQGLLRNPLAEPGLLGVSAAASLGAVITLYFGLSAIWPLATPLAGGLGALIAGALLLRAGAGSNTVILAGVGISALAGAGVALALNLAPNGYAALEIAFWLLGSLADRSMTHVMLAVPFIVLGIALLLACGRGLDALTLGEDTAASLGIDLRRLYVLAVGGTALAVGGGVAVAGSIGFVGLVVPHLLRRAVGHEPGRLLLPSALGGATLLLAADIAVRLAPTQQELRLGVLTALVGAPFFLALLARLRREERP